MSPSRTVIRLLIVEDHVALAQNLADFFEGDDYILDFAADGLSALHLLSSNTYDVVVLDIMLPGLNGFDVCHRMRQELGLGTPVIMMTAKDQIPDKERGFLAGSDDYLVKPFSLRELQLRIDALHKRGQGRHEQSGIAVGDLRYHPGTLTVTASGKGSVELSGNAARLFETLIRAYPDYVSYLALAESAWGEKEVDPHVIRTHVYMLRKQLQTHFDRNLIKTVHGRGYKLSVDEE